MGWYTTEMRGYDNRAITIPNAQIAEATTINYSRVHHQLLKTKLRLRRADAPRVDALVTDIRKTLAATDGAVDDRENKTRSRVLEGYCPDTGSPEIDVECHYLGSDTDEFLEWREGVLLAIYDAVQRADCELTWKTSLEVRRQFADGVGDVQVGAPLTPRTAGAAPPRRGRPSESTIFDAARAAPRRRRL
ncbi:mechanosensitive ion channel [Aureococcus anophagefferens]|nr:mechanosensitive ion channel [Aureococcus anophagefferens]